MDVTLCGLKHQLDQLNGRLNKGDARRVACDSDVPIKDWRKLKNEDWDDNLGVQNRLRLGLAIVVLFSKTLVLIS
ncbi:hypothetical protein QL285_032713 [Trifolium repens]|nr:hypothetical protein QL285_032713 [Trifolium repens]